jgi:hypothetical protein
MVIYRLSKLGMGRHRSTKTQVNEFELHPRFYPKSSKDLMILSSFSSFRGFVARRNLVLPFILVTGRNLHSCSDCGSSVRARVVSAELLSSFGTAPCCITYNNSYGESSGILTRTKCQSLRLEGSIMLHHGKISSVIKVENLPELSCNRRRRRGSRSRDQTWPSP